MYRRIASGVLRRLFPASPSIPYSRIEMHTIIKRIGWTNNSSSTMKNLEMDFVFREYLFRNL